MTDWTAAMKIAGTGFASVFIVLATLAISIWIVSSVIRKVGQKTTKSPAESLRVSSQSSAEQPQSPTHGETDFKGVDK
jgi:Na+-transporting methylmalonyl-CoA/oxaloacetate decarboxylase gamma subunit